MVEINASNHKIEFPKVQGDGITTYGKKLGRFLRLFGAVAKLDGKDERYVGIYSLRRFIKAHKSELQQIKAPRIYSSGKIVNQCIQEIASKLQNPNPIGSFIRDSKVLEKERRDSTSGEPDSDESGAKESEAEQPKAKEPQAKTEDPGKVEHKEPVTGEHDQPRMPADSKAVQPEAKVEAAPVAVSAYDSVSIPSAVREKYDLIAERLKTEPQKFLLPQLAIFMTQPDRAVILIEGQINALPEDKQGEYYGLTYQLMKSIQEHEQDPRLNSRVRPKVIYLAETYLDIEKSKEGLNPLAIECARLIYDSTTSDHAFKGDAAYYLGREQEQNKRLNSAQTYFEESYESYSNAVKKSQSDEERNTLLRCQIDAGYALSRLMQAKNLPGAFEICNEIKKFADTLKLKLDYVNELWLEQYKNVEAEKKKNRTLQSQVPQADSKPVPANATGASKSVETVSSKMNEVELKKKYQTLSQFVQRIDKQFEIKMPFPTLDRILDKPWEFGKAFYESMRELFEDQFLKEGEFNQLVRVTHEFLKVMENNFSDVEANLQVSLAIAYLNVEEPQVANNRAYNIIERSKNQNLQHDARIYVLAEKATKGRDKIAFLNLVLVETRNAPETALEQRLAAAEKLFFLKTPGWTPTEESAAVVCQHSRNRIFRASAASFLADFYKNKAIESSTLEKQDLEKGDNLLKAAKYYFTANQNYKQEADELSKETDLSIEEKRGIATLRNFQAKNADSALECCKDSIELLEPLRPSLTSKILPDAKSFLSKLSSR